MPKYAFDETAEALQEITRLYDFVWPTAIALWNMRWQIDGYRRATPNASVEVLYARFGEGSNLSSTDLKAMIDKFTWEDQKERFAEIILTNTFAIYETWAERLDRREKRHKASDKDLAFWGNGRTTGILGFIKYFNSKSSTVMKDNFLQGYAKNKGYHPDILENMIRCYRYFKEVRNRLIHGGGIADQKTVDSFAEFQLSASAASLKLKERIEHDPAILGQRVRLSLRGVVGFSAIVRRLIVTVDAEVSGSLAAQNQALDRLRQLRGPRPTLSAREARQRHQVEKICMHGGLPPPADWKEARDFLLAHQIVSY